MRGSARSRMSEGRASWQTRSRASRLSHPSSAILAKAAIGCTHLCRRVRRSPIHLAPRQRGEGGAQRVSVGRVRGARSLGAALSWTKGRRVNVPAVRLRGAAKKEVTGTPLTLPLLRNGPPLSPLRGRAVYERCLAGTWPAKGGWIRE